MHLIPNSYGVRLREFNPCHEPGGSGKGGQFSGKGSGNCADPSEIAKGATSPTMLPGKTPLLTSDVVDHQDLGGGISTSMVVTLADGSKAVYKPEVGEAWPKSGWTNADIADAIIVNPKFSQAAREAASYQVDQLLGTNLVPETVLREEVDVESGGEGDDEGGGYGHDTLQQMYDEWRQGKIENGAFDDRVSEVMLEKYDEARGDFVRDVRHMADGVITDLWNEVVDEHPEIEDPAEKYGEDIDNHPVLRGQHGPGDPDGTIGFNPRIIRDELDPLDVIRDAGFDGEDLEGRRHWDNKEDRAALKAAITKAYVEDGFRNLGDLDDDRAGEMYREFGDWIGDHGDTEMHVMDSMIASYSAWKADQGYTSGGGGRGGGGGYSGGNPNFRLGSRAPHPNGGSLQRMVPDAEHWGDLDEEALIKFAVLDYATGQMDRHHNNYLWGKGGEAYAIDNGMSFPRYNGITFRSDPTRMFRNGGPTSDSQKGLLSRLQRNVEKSDWDGFLAKQDGMSAEEKSAFKKRVVLLNEALKTQDGLYKLWKDQILY